MQNLKKKNEEYKRAMVEMRTFIKAEGGQEPSSLGKEAIEKPGHHLLGNTGKILVIGVTELGVNVMQGIAGYSSCLQKLRAVDGMPFTADARNCSGKLVVTKESFRTALKDICKNLREN